MKIAQCLFPVLAVWSWVTFAQEPAPPIRFLAPGDGEVVSNSFTIRVETDPAITQLKLVVDGRYDLGQLGMTQWGEGVEANQFEFQARFEMAGRRLLAVSPPSPLAAFPEARAERYVSVVPTFELLDYDFYARLGEKPYPIPPMYNRRTGVNLCLGWVREVVSRQEARREHRPIAYGTANKARRAASRTFWYLPWDPSRVQEIFNRLQPDHLIFWNVGKYGHVGVVYRERPDETYPMGRLCVIHNLSRRITRWYLEGDQPYSLGLPGGWSGKIAGFYLTW